LAKGNKATTLTTEDTEDAEEEQKKPFTYVGTGGVAKN
jgi:hypothetical protein